MIKIKNIDHFVLTVKDYNRTMEFYTRVLGMEPVYFQGGRLALKYGDKKINLHLTGQEITPHAANPQPGSADFCLITETPIQEVVEHLVSCKISIIEGPVEKTGAGNALLSIYIHDPDKNLIEISNIMKE